VRLTLISCYELDESLDSAGLFRLGTLVAGCDQVCAELAVHGMSGLRDHVDQVVSERLHLRCSMLDAWLDAPLRPFRHDGHDYGDIIATDLTSVGQTRTLDLGATAGVDVGQHLLGRVVPIEQAPGVMFEERPLYVDAQTALDVATGEHSSPLPGWLGAVERGTHAGRLPCAVGRRAATPLTSDVPYDRGPGSPAAWHDGSTIAAQGV
jgi:hypothetical protein